MSPAPSLRKAVNLGLIDTDKQESAESIREGSAEEPPVSGCPASLVKISARDTMSVAAYYGAHDTSTVPLHTQK